MTPGWRRVLWPGLMTVVMLAVLLSLGTWQVHRRAWKAGILAAIARAEVLPAIPLPADPAPFSKVRLEGTMRGDLAGWYGAEVRTTAGGARMGAHVLVPVERRDGPPVLLDRGWAPDGRLDGLPWPAGAVSVEGYVRPAETASRFGATDNPATRRFYTLDPAAIGAGLGLARVAPFVVVALGSPAPQLLPEPATRLPRPPNDHLAYAITWYGLAAVLVVIFLVYARKVLRA